MAFESVIRNPAIWRFVISLLLLTCASAHAQISAPPRVPAAYDNAVGAGLSYGEFSNRDAAFWGWSIEYGRVLNPSWTAGLSIAWDEETERIVGGPGKTVRSYTLIGTISYNLTQRLGLTTGLAKSFADDDNNSGSMKFNSGDVSTGVSAAYAWPLGLRNTISTSLAYEYNLSQNEPSVSFDVTLGWGF